MALGHLHGAQADGALPPQKKKKGSKTGGSEASPEQMYHGIAPKRSSLWLPTTSRKKPVVCLSCPDMAAADFQTYDTSFSPSVTPLIRKHITKNCGRFITKLELISSILPSSSPIITDCSHDSEHHHTWVFHGKDICCPNKITS